MFVQAQKEDEPLTKIPSSLLKTVTFSNTTSGSIAANTAPSSGISLTTTTSLTGYSPMGIININSGPTTLVLNGVTRSGNSYTFWLRNVTSSAVSYNAGTFTINVVYVKTS